MSSQYPTSTTFIRSTPSRRKWFIDFQIRKHERVIVSTNENNLTTTNNHNLLLSPIGYSEQRVSDLLTQEDDERLLARRSWDIALQPIKQLPMNMVLAWMAGNSFSLMSIMIVVMLFMKPIQVKSSISLEFEINWIGFLGNLFSWFSIFIIRTGWVSGKYLVT
jgi:hypothetical protein